MEIDRIRQFVSPIYPVVSVYVNRTGVPRARTSVSARLADLLRPIKALEDGGDLSHEAVMSLRTDVKAIQDLADRMEVDPAPAVAVFACHGEGLFEYFALARQVWDVARAGPRPYLRPLRAGQMTYRSAAVVMDKRRSLVYVDEGNEFVEYSEVIEEAVRKSNYGGFAGYEERSVRSHADEVASRHYRETADVVFALFQERGFDFLFLGGHQDMIEEGARYLHPYVRVRLSGYFVVDPHTVTTPMVREQVRSLEAEAVAAQETARVRELLDTAAAGGLAVLGITEVLAAANAKAIDQLIVSGSFAKEGTVCDACGFLARNGTSCPVCGSTTRRTEDLVADVIEGTLADRGDVLQVSIASALDGKAIGAMLRFPLPGGLLR